MTTADGTEYRGHNIELPNQRNEYKFKVTLEEGATHSYDTMAAARAGIDAIELHAVGKLALAVIQETSQGPARGVVTGINRQNGRLNGVSIYASTFVDHPVVSALLARRAGVSKQLAELNDQLDKFQVRTRSYASTPAGHGEALVKLQSDYEKSVALAEELAEADRAHVLGA